MDLEFVEPGDVTEQEYLSLLKISNFACPKPVKARPFQFPAPPNELAKPMPLKRTGNDLHANQSLHLARAAMPYFHNLLAEYIQAGVLVGLNHEQKMVVAVDALVRRRFLDDKGTYNELPDRSKCPFRESFAVRNGSVAYVAADDFHGVPDFFRELVRSWKRAIREANGSTLGYWKKMSYGGKQVALKSTDGFLDFRLTTEQAVAEKWKNIAAWATDVGNSQKVYFVNSALQRWQVLDVQKETVTDIGPMTKKALLEISARGGFDFAIDYNVLDRTRCQCSARRKRKRRPVRPGKVCRFCHSGVCDGCIGYVPKSPKDPFFCWKDVCLGSVRCRESRFAEQVVAHLQRKAKELKLIRPGVGDLCAKVLRVLIDGLALLKCHPRKEEHLKKFFEAADREMQGCTAGSLRKLLSGETVRRPHTSDSEMDDLFLKEDGWKAAKKTWLRESGGCPEWLVEAAHAYCEFYARGAHGRLGTYRNVVLLRAETKKKQVMEVSRKTFRKNLKAKRAGRMDLEEEPELEAAPMEVEEPEVLVPPRRMDAEEAAEEGPFASPRFPGFPLAELSEHMFSQCTRLEIYVKLCREYEEEVWRRQAAVDVED